MKFVMKNNEYKKLVQIPFTSAHVELTCSFTYLNISIPASEINKRDRTVHFNLQSV